LLDKPVDEVTGLQLADEGELKDGIGYPVFKAQVPPYVRKLDAAAASILTFCPAVNNVAQPL